MAEINTNLQLTPEKFQVTGIDKSESEKIYRKSMTYWQDVWRRLKSDKLAIFAGILLILLVLLTIVGPMISGYKFDSFVVKDQNMTPNSAHWFGTDTAGRDLFTRVCQGGRVSMAIGLISTAVMAIVGVVYGGIAGYFGGIVDDIMMRIVEILSCLPNLVIVILLSLIMGKNVAGLIFALTVTSWITTARIVRGKILQIKEQEFVLAAHALGASPSRIIAKHLLPNTLGLVLVDITFSVPGFIFSESFLSYIGLGVQSPKTSWGALAAAGQQEIMFHAYQLFFPCLLISLTMLSFQLLGDGLNDAMDPKLRQ